MLPNLFQGHKKGEMCSLAFQEGSKWGGSFIGWIPWHYARDEIVTSHRRKAEFVAAAVAEFKCIPSSLETVEYNGTSEQLLVISVFVGDGLYSNCTKYID